MVPVVVGEDAQACRDLLKPFLALYLGGMGAPGRNFYLDLADRLGYGGPGRRVQELYLEGRKGEAAGAVPDALVDEVALAGPADRIRDRLGAWNSSGVTMLIASTLQPDVLHVLAESVG
jgi:alkanesulfonate monooxygenase SsuD/methylene tetrahydromethanopterin reductase-like flavin-dependent oxidoreductase (luciferase family)